MNFTFEFEPSGNIAVPNSGDLEKLDDHNAIVVFTQGAMQDGRSYYAYTAVKPSLYKKFCQMTRSGQAVVLGEYGEVIAAGFSFNPPPEVVDKMQRKYGCNPQFQDNLINEALRQQKVFLGKQQERRIETVVGMLKRRKKSE